MKNKHSNLSNLKCPKEQGRKDIWTNGGQDRPRGKSKTWFKGFLRAVQILVVIIICEFDMVLGPSAESVVPKLNFSIVLKDVILSSYCQKPNKTINLFPD